MRFETEPGLQAQVDWKEFRRQIVDGRETKLYAFVMVLGYSRKAFVRFTTSMDTATMLACHLLAFAYFGGVPWVIFPDYVPRNIIQVMYPSSLCGPFA